MSPRFITAVMAAILALLPSLGNASVTANPIGLSEALEQGDAAEATVTLTNDGDQDVTYAVKFRKVDRDQRQRGPLRDDPGDIIAQYRIENGRWYTGIAWDGEEMWGFNHNGGQVISYDPVANEVTERWNAGFQGQTGMECVEAEVWIPSRADGLIHRFNRRGDALENIRVPRDQAIDIAWDGELIWYTCLGNDRTNLIQMNRQSEIQRVVALPNGQWDGWASIEFVEEHPDGQMWIRDHGRSIYQLNIENNNAQVVQTIQRQLGNEFGLSHDGENIWYTVDGQDTWVVMDDGVTELRWLMVEPTEGVVQANNESDLVFSFTSEGIEDGVYEFWVDLEFVEEPESNIRMSAVLTVGQAASIRGVISDAETGEPIEGAIVSLDYYVYERSTDGNGIYNLAHLPSSNYRLTITATDYLSTFEDVDLGERDVELDVALLHSTCEVSVDSVHYELAPGTDTDVSVTLSNLGNGPLTWRTDRRLVGDADAEPWELRQRHNVGQTFDDDRMEGVAFDGTNFYLSGANGNDPNMIYVMGRDGEPVRDFVQPGNSRYGMKDLEYDGRLFWGTGEPTVYGFDDEGNVEVQFQGPGNPNANIAWDSDDDILWISGATTDIYNYDRAGNALGRRINRKNIRLNGLSYWPDDPDRFKLYAFTSAGNGALTIYKYNLVNGDTIRVRNLPPVASSTPGGLYITNQFDIYSWVAMSMVSLPPDSGNDYLQIHQLDVRKDWFEIAPESGTLEAGDDQELVVHLDANGLPEAEFRGEIVFEHDGQGSQTVLPVILSVVNGPVHSIRVIPLRFGWNLISANLQPDEVDIPTNLSDLVDAGIVLMVKDDEGHYYSPERDFSNLPDWLVSEAYWIKVNETCQFSVDGMTVMSDTPLALHEGWQAISYYPRRPVDGIIALSNVADRLVIAKDIYGNFYLPALNFSNLGMMQEGRGYQVKMTEAVELVYNLQAGGLAGIRSTSVYEMPGRYPIHPPTGSNMSLLIEADGLTDGTDVGVFSGDVLVGCGVVHNFRAGIAVWGDDPATTGLDGAVEGAALQVRLLDDAGEKAVFAVEKVGELRYSTDGLTIASIVTEASPTGFGLIESFPNPFNSTIHLGYALPEAVNVHLGVYDLSGRLVEELVSQRQEAGKYRLVWSGEGSATGLYLVRLNAGEHVQTQRILLVK